MARRHRNSIPVVAYLWLDGGAIVASVPALEYWPPAGTKTKDGSRYVLRGENHAHLGKPTHERLENGVIVAIKKDGGSRGGTISFYRNRVSPTSHSISPSLEPMPAMA